MTTRMDDLSDAAVEGAESDVERVMAPDFAAVLARAQGIRAEVATAPVRVEDEVALKPFVVAAIAQAEGDIAVVEQAPAEVAPPALPEQDVVMMWNDLPQEQPRRSTRWKPVVAIGSVLLAAAAVVVLAFPGSWRLQPQNEEADGSEAVSAIEAAGAEAEPFETKVVPTPKKVEPRAQPRPAIPEEEDEPAIVPALPKAPIESIDDKLKRLDAQAEKQLGEGQMDAADRTLSQLIEVGGKRRLVELAYGDRFTIAHRRHDTKKQVALWQGYLRRFPKGRLADDARAGLCRHAAEKRRAGCWRDYLRDFPGGAYSEQARREAGPAPP